MILTRELGMPLIFLVPWCPCFLSGRSGHADHCYSLQCMLSAILIFSYASVNAKYIYIYIYVSVIKTCMQVAERPWTLKSLSVATLNWFGLRLWIEHHPMGHSSITHDNIIWIFLFVIYGSLTKWRQQTIYKFMKKPYCGTQSLSLIIISLAVFPLFHDYEMFAWLYFRLLDWYSPI